MEFCNKPAHETTFYLIKIWTFQFVQRIGTGWTVRESNSGAGEVFRLHPYWPWDPPTPLYSMYRVCLLEGKAANM